MHLTTLLLALPLLASAAPIQTTVQATTQITPPQIQQIAPKSASCANRPAKGECATAAQAAPNISKSFEKYGVTSRAEQAAVVALMAFESGEFRYSRNQVPGVVGQGTRNMQSPAYNAKYASSLSAIADKVSAASGNAGRILDILLADEEYDFGSGAWFLTTQCSAEVRTALQSGSEEGWKGYIGGCVGTEASEGRREYWEKAVEALGS